MRDYGLRGERRGNPDALSNHLYGPGVRALEKRLEAGRQEQARLHDSDMNLRRLRHASRFHSPPVWSRRDEAEIILFAIVAAIPIAFGFVGGFGASDSPRPTAQGGLTLPPRPSKAEPIHRTGEQFKLLSNFVHAKVIENNFSASASTKSPIVIAAKDNNGDVYRFTFCDDFGRDAWRYGPFGSHVKLDIPSDGLSLRRVAEALEVGKVICFPKQVGGYEIFRLGKDSPSPAEMDFAAVQVIVAPPATTKQ